MTAPVTGSCGLPAWTASVPKPCTGEGALGGVSMGSSVKEGDIFGIYMLNFEKVGGMKIHKGQRAAQSCLRSLVRGRWRDRLPPSQSLTGTKRKLVEDGSLQVDMLDCIYCRHVDGYKAVEFVIEGR